VPPCLRTGTEVIWGVAKSGTGQKQPSSHFKFSSRLGTGLQACPPASKVAPGCTEGNTASAAQRPANPAYYCTTPRCLPVPPRVPPVTSITSITSINSTCSLHQSIICSGGTVRPVRRTACLPRPSVNSSPGSLKLRITADVLSPGPSLGRRGFMYPLRGQGYFVACAYFLSWVPRVTDRNMTYPSSVRPQSVKISHGGP
jgi:hypothetical protein